MHIIIGLLVLIAIGVLQLSEEGKKMFDFMSKICIFGGLLYGGFWLIVLLITACQNPTTREIILGVAGIIIFIFLCGYLTNPESEKFRNWWHIKMKPIDNLWKFIQKHHKLIWWVSIACLMLYSIILALKQG